MSATWTIVLTGPVTMPSRPPNPGDPATYTAPMDLQTLQLSLAGSSLTLNLQVLVLESGVFVPVPDLPPFTLSGGGVYRFPRPARRAPATVSAFPPPVPTRDGVTPLVPCYAANYMGFSVAVPWPPLVVAVQVLPGAGGPGTFAFTLGPDDATGS